MVKIFNAVPTSRICLAMCKMEEPGQYLDASYCLDAPNEIVTGSTVFVHSSPGDSESFATSRYTTRDGWLPSAP